MQLPSSTLKAGWKLRERLSVQPKNLNTQLPSSMVAAGS